MADAWLDEILEEGKSGENGIEKYVEFQAVIICVEGDGQKLFPLTERTPTTLLNVANRPLIAYQLQMLDDARFKEVMVVTTTSNFPQIEKYCFEIYEKVNLTKITVVPIDDHLGSCEALRAVKDRITSDFLVLSGDLVTNVDIHHLADIHRSRDATLTCLLSRDSVDSEGPVKKKPKFDITKKTLIALDHVNHSRVVYYKPGHEVAEDDVLSINRQLFRNYPSFTMSTSLNDAHCYIFSHWVLKVVEAMEDHLSIQNDLVPFLIEYQFSDDTSIDAMKPLNAQHIALSMSVTSWRGPPGRVPDPLRPADRDEDAIRVFAYIGPDKKFCKRAVYPDDFKEMNSTVARLAMQKGSDVSFREVAALNELNAVKKANPKASIGPNCFVTESIRIGEGAVLKRCVVGRHCRIGKGAKLTNTVLMAHSVVEDGCVIKDSVLCENASVAKDADLDQVIVSTSVNVEEGASLRKEIVSGTTFEF